VVIIGRGAGVGPLSRGVSYFSHSEVISRRLGLQTRPLLNRRSIKEVGSGDPTYGMRLFMKRSVTCELVLAVLCMLTVGCQQSAHQEASDAHVVQPPMPTAEVGLDAQLTNVNLPMPGSDGGPELPNLPDMSVNGQPQLPFLPGLPGHEGGPQLPPLPTLPELPGLEDKLKPPALPEIPQPQQPDQSN